MKLTAKGFFNLMKKHDQPIDVDLANMVSEHEFEPDDFEGAVVLTMDEAKKIKGALESVRISLSLEESGLRLQMAMLLKKRIKQGEKRNE